MSDFNLSTNMNMPVPTVSVAPGPDWATLLNACLAILDGHTHTTGSGVPITPSGMNINTDLTFNSNNATDLRSARFTAQGSPIALPADVGCLYVAGVDLYYNDVSGNQIRITTNGSVSGASGSISGLTPPASASYNSTSKTFVWQSDVSTPANMDAASYIFRKVAASSPGITVSVPSSIASDYSLVWPVVPATESYVTLDTGGNFLTTIEKSRSFIQPGTIVPFGNASTPTGWLACDGSAVSRTTYAGLFSAIGTTYGSGNGTTTFNVPDFRGSLLTKTVVAKAYGAVGTTSAGNILIIPNEVFDTTSSYDPVTGQFTAPLTGYYRVSGFFGSANTGVYTAVYVDGTLIFRLTFSPSGSGVMNGSQIVYVTAGQTIDVRPDAGVMNLTSDSWVTYERVEGPSNDNSGTASLVTNYIIKT